MASESTSCCAVHDGAAEVIPVDPIIPGCPPKPAEIVAALVLLMKTVKQKKK